MPHHLAALFLAAVELVSDGRPQLHVESDGSPAARHAADLVRRTVVLMTGAAVPDRGAGAALRFERTETPGYAVREADGGLIVAGADPVRAAYDLLEGWGCRFSDGDPVIPKRRTLAIEARAWKPARRLYVEGTRLDPSLPAQGLCVRGVAVYERAPPDPTRLGYELRVASETFDDFLPPALFAKHPEWFARRGGKRVPRGNFALTNADARAAYLDSLGAWLTAHPGVACTGIWPEVTTVWDEDALALGAPEAYALLWREAAARFPKRRFEILATGLTLIPPAGNVPHNVDVRLRPGRSASGLQGLAEQDIARIVEAWKARGARLVLEIDAAPAAWCGMPWPCFDALRANARLFSAAVLRGGGQAHARLWRDPDTPRTASKRYQDLLERARHVRSWGHPRDAADLFLDESFGNASGIARAERALRTALDQSKPPAERSGAAGEAFLGYQALRRALKAPHDATYRRYRERDFRAAIEKLSPEGVVHQVGPARVRETPTLVVLETDRLRLTVERATGAIIEVRRKQGDAWGDDLTGGHGRYFVVVPLRAEGDRIAHDVHVVATEDAGVRIDLHGTIGIGGPAWHSRLRLHGSRIRQTAHATVAGGIAVGCRWRGAVFDRWVCPPFAAEGRVTGERVTLPLPPGTLVYCRAGERGPGLAVRSVVRGLAILTPGEEPTLVATNRTGDLTVDWFVFTGLGELGK